MSNDTQTFVVTCNGVQQVIEFSKFGTIGGLRKTIQDAFQISNCRLLGLDTDDVPLASMPQLSPHQSITVVPQQETKRLAVARVMNYADTREGPVPGGSGPGSSLGSSNTPTYSDLLRRIVQLTNLVFLNDGDQTRSEMLELQEKYERLSAQNWQLRQQLLQLNGGNSSLESTNTNAFTASQIAGSQGEIEALRGEIAELQEHHRLRVTDLELRLEAALTRVSQLESAGTAPGSGSVAANNSPGTTGVAGTIEEGRLYEEVRDLRILSGAGTVMQGGSSTGTPSTASEADLGWLSPQDRSQLLADAASAARAQTIVECAQILSTTMQISFEQARAILCGETDSTPQSQLGTNSSSQHSNTNNPSGNSSIGVSGSSGMSSDAQSSGYSSLRNPSEESATSDNQRGRLPTLDE